MKSFLELVEEKTTGPANTHGLFKAVFVSGGPGSGKDVIIREAISEQAAVEMNAVQAFVFLADKKALSEKTNDYRREAIRQRGPLIINGPADDLARITYIKEELEDMGYSTLMIFVNTSDEVSKVRNAKLSRMMNEDMRHEKWNKSQKSRNVFSQLFEGFVEFDNSDSITDSQESISDISTITQNFFASKTLNDISESWLKTNGKLNRFLNESKAARSIQSSTVKKYNPFYKAAGPSDAIPDNDGKRNPMGQDDQIKGNTFPRKDPNGQAISGGYRGGYNESAPTLKIVAPAKEPNFRMDKDKAKKLKRGDTSLGLQKMTKPSGVGPEYNSRAAGASASAGAGIGNNTYSEENLAATSPRGVSVNPLDARYENKEFNKFRKTIKKEGIDDPGANDMGLAGTLGGASNKEGMDSYKDTLRNIKNDYGFKIKRKKGRK